MPKQTTPKRVGCPPGPQGPRPNAWKTGPDPLTHEQYTVFVQARNQAQWRGNTWTITFEEYQSLWSQHWNNRGRRRDQYCLTRRDDTQPWTRDNAVVIRRDEHALRSGTKGGTSTKKYWEKRNQHSEQDN